MTSGLYDATGVPYTKEQAAQILASIPDTQDIIVELVDTDGIRVTTIRQPFAIADVGRIASAHLLPKGVIE